MSPANSISEIVRACDIRHVADTFGSKRRGNRCPAVWRNSNDLNVSLDPAKGLFFDHVAGEGGGIVRFVELCAGLDRAAAVGWLSQFTGIGLPEETPGERAEWARRRKAAEQEAAEFEAWRRNRIAALQMDRDRWLRTHHRHARLVIKYSFDDPRASYWADVSEFSEERYLAIEVQLDAIRKPQNWSGLLTEFRGEVAA